MPEYIRKQMGEKLVEEGLITQEQYDQAMKKHWESRVLLRQVLVDMGAITEDQLMDFMAQQLGIPLLKDLGGKISDPEVIQLIPEKTCRDYCVMPLSRSEGVLSVAMADPFDVFAIDDLEGLTKCKIDTVLCGRDEILKTVELFYEAKEPLEEIVRGMTEEAEELEIIKDKEEDVTEEVSDLEEAPIIRLVNTIISQAVKERASDIHIEPDDKTLRIRYRIDGVLRESMSPPKKLQASITSRIKIMAGMDISIKRAPQDGRFRMRIENKDFDVRISSVPTIYGEKVVMRLLDQSTIRMGLPDAGFTADCLTRFEEMIERPYGIILVTGPTGSGKTTTLYLALQTINSPDKNIITIEEPVEYDLEGINQIAVNVKAGVSFASGLRSILRQDPDVIMVGEMRDLETADVAVRAALTGHLVFSTLHTNDAPSSIVRMVDMGVPPYLVTSAVSCVLAQRLVRKLCPLCREPYRPAPEVLREVGLDENDKDIHFSHGKGCEECGETGYLGRVGLFELMPVDKDLRKLIHAKASGDEIRSAAQKAGMKGLWEDGLDKVMSGVTSLEELKRVSFMDQE